jgi:hypothetical protein
MDSRQSDRRHQRHVEAQVELTGAEYNRSAHSLVKSVIHRTYSARSRADRYQGCTFLRYA